MEKNHYVGIDVSKLTLDISIFEEGKDVKYFDHIQVANDKEGWKEMLRELKRKGVKPVAAAFMMEYTGCYSDGIRGFLDHKRLTYVMANPLEVKLRSGITRGKNDKIDSARIADYLGRFHDVLSPSHLPSANLLHLDALRKERKYMVEMRTSLKNRIQTVTFTDELNRHDSTIRLFDRKIDTIEEQILKLIDSDEEIKKTYELLLTIPGIGMVNAVNVIAITENFTAFANARQYASYIGVAPYRRDSGTSVHRRPKPSTFSDLQAKADLSEAADSARQNDWEMRRYYERRMNGKTSKEDPHTHRKTLNNIKFKLITRMFSVVQKGEPYQKLDEMKNRKKSTEQSVVAEPHTQNETENYGSHVPGCPCQSVQEAPVASTVRNLDEGLIKE